MASTQKPEDLTFDDRAESLVEWAKANANKLMIGGVVIAVVALVGFLWRSSADKKELRASEELGRVQRVVESGNAALAESDLQAMLRRYGGTTAGIQARLLLAQVYFGQGKVDEGLRELDQVKSPGPYAASLSGLKAAGLEQAGKLAEAAAAYQQAAAAAPTELARAGYQSDAARTFLAAGNADEARRIWQAMASDDASPLAGEARVRLGELQIKPIGQG
jgi:predicted negative regulator of RcsB-dependent stress response